MSKPALKRYRALVATLCLTVPLLFVAIKGPATANQPTAVSDEASHDRVEMIEAGTLTVGRLIVETEAGLFDRELSIDLDAYQSTMGRKIDQERLLGLIRDDLDGLISITREDVADATARAASAFGAGEAVREVYLK